MRKAIERVALAATVTVSVTAAHAYNQPPPCPAQPTLAQCQDPAFMYGACGAPFLADARTNPDAICNTLLEDAALAAAAGLGAEPVLVPPVVDATGAVTPAGGVDAARIAPGNAQPIDTVGGQDLAAPAAAGGLMFAMRMPDGEYPLPPLPEPEPEPDPTPTPPPPPPQTPAPPATAHDAPVFDCAGYARDRFHGYTLFDDAAAAIAEDHRAVFDLAYGPADDLRALGTRGEAGVGLVGTDGRPFWVPWPAGLQPKNTWFTVALAPAADHSVDPVVDPGDGSLIRLKGVVLDDPALEATLLAGRTDHSEDFGWHREMSEALSGELDERLVDLERAQARFAELLDRRAMAVDEGLIALRQAWRAEMGEAVAECLGLTPIGGLMAPNDPGDPGGGWDPVGDCMEAIDIDAEMAPHRAQVASRLRAFDVAIRDRLHAAMADGCLDVGEASACDWSPRRFAQRMRDLLGASRQRAYEKCLAYTGDDFPALEDYTFTHPIGGQVLYPRADYTQSPAGIEVFMLRRDHWRRLLAAELDEVLEADGAADGGPRMTGGASDAVQMGNDLFGAGYAYDMRWQVFDIEHGLCNLAATFDADFTADVSVMGRSRDLIAADTHAGFDRIDVDLEVFGQSLVDVHQPLIDQETYTLVDGDISRQQSLLDATYRFTILGIPMSLEVGAAGKVGLGYGLEAELDRGGAECASVSATLGGRLSPTLEFDGFAEVGVDFVIAKAGVKGELALAHVRLPFDLELGIGAAGGAVADLALTVASSLEAAVRLLDGKLSLFAEVGIGPLSESAQKTFFDWSGLETEFDVLGFESRVPLATLVTWFTHPM